MPINQEAELGMNRTGTLMSPVDAMDAKRGAEELTVPPAGDSSAIAENRISFMLEYDEIGSVPMPASLKGMITTVQEKLRIGHHAFLDKLGERLAFERTGTRLYEALLSKYQASDDKEILPPLSKLEQFYQEELLHFYMLTDIVTELGGDPTAITPAANIGAMSSIGWLQVMSDPRISFVQSLEILLQAELVDNAGWELLITLADETGLTEISEQFQKAQEEENVHLESVREWVNNLILSGEATVDVKIKH